jgi:hypothetical protein
MISENASTIRTNVKKMSSIASNELIFNTFYFTSIMNATTMLSTTKIPAITIFLYVFS